MTLPQNLEKPIELLSDAEKRVLLAELLSARSDEPQSFPLSFAQERLWFLDRLMPDSPAYNIPGAFRLKGILDADALAGGLSDVVRRHQTLRTVFNEIDGRPIQTVLPAAPINLPIRTVEGETETEQLLSVSRSVDAIVRMPIALTTGPVFRAELFRLNDRDHVLLVVIHHICADGWSLGIFNTDLKTAYEARLGGRRDALPQLEVTYTSFAAWQRQHLQGDRLDQLVAYWRDALAGLPALDLPLDHPRPPIQCVEGDCLQVSLDHDLVERIKVFAARQGSTLFCVLLAALQATLSRLSGQSDFAIASPAANRTRLETEEQIGFFVNTLPLRADLTKNPTFSELVSDTRRITEGAQQHQDLPFEKLVDELNVPRDTSRNPLVQILFALQNAPMQPLDLIGLQAEPFPYSLPASRFEIELHLWDGRRTWTGAQNTESGLVGSLFFNSHLFERATAQAIFCLFEAVLRTALRLPDERLSNLTVMSQEQIDTSLAVGRGPVVEDHQLPNLTCMLDDARRKFADRTAYVDTDNSLLSFAQLFDRADRIRGGLRELDLPSPPIVALAMTRGPDLVCAMIAIMMAGGTFVSIDPSQPAARISKQISQSGAALVFSDVDGFAGNAVQVSRVSDLIDKTGYRSTPEPSADQIAPAYVVFTSGSTGEPKGIAMPRRALANLMLGQTASLPNAAKTLHSSSVGFDVAIQEVFHTLLTGGTLVQSTQAIRLDPARLLDLLAEQSIQRIYLPATLLGIIGDECVRQNRSLPALHTIITAGEQPLVTARLRNFFEQNKGLRLINQYGPAESHVVSELILDGDPSDWPDRPSAGKAVPGARLYVLDANGTPVPTNLPGELYIAGTPVALGYVGDAELTQQRFTRDPFHTTSLTFGDMPETNANMYRTGDRAKLDQNGNLHILGRMDDQVKIRGFRVEPAEIEHAICNLAEVEACAVMAEATQSGSTQLRAYVVLTEAGRTITATGLRDALRAELTDYMMPSSFARVPKISTLPSGKCDRHALSALAVPIVDPATSRIPTTPTEQIISQCWCDVLSVLSVNCDQTFFDAGGNSLMIIELHQRLSMHLEMPLTVADLFQFPTVTEMARIVDARQAQGFMTPSRSNIKNRAQRQRARLGGTSL